MLCPAQVASGHCVEIAMIVASSESIQPLVDRVGGLGVAVHVVEIPPRRYGLERQRVGERIREMAPDVVHLHGYRAIVVDGPVARRLGIPLVVTVHGVTSKGWKGRYYEWLNLRECRRADTVVAVSRPLAEQLVARGIPHNRVHTIVNAWNDSQESLSRAAARRALGIPEHHYQIGWIGRLSHEKGADILLDALPRLADLDFEVSMVGGGRLQSTLERRARRHRLDHRVRWHGPVANMPQLYQAFDLVVLSSRTEGTPIVLLEAMAAGVPLIATTVGGVPDAVSPAEVLLIPPLDPAALAEAIRVACGNPAAASQRADHARRRLATQFAIEPWVERYDRAYRAAMQRSRSNP
jgi:glycosyltransferase involved in cell wall biosynthesis